MRKYIFIKILDITDSGRGTMHDAGYLCPSPTNDFDIRDFFEMDKNTENDVTIELYDKDGEKYDARFYRGSGQYRVAKLKKIYDKFDVTAGDIVLTIKEVDDSGNKKYYVHIIKNRNIVYCSKTKGTDDLYKIYHFERLKKYYNELSQMLCFPALYNGHKENVLIEYDSKEKKSDGSIITLEKARIKIGDYYIDSNLVTINVGSNICNIKTIGDYVEYMEVEI